jgi:DNA mismatch repair protein MutL
MKIKILDPILQNQIAAGEVVERPASVLKEIIENSIDANSNEILVELKNGGKDFIKITDNGEGILKEDLNLSILRYATSKISSNEDLLNINSLGFRGEALASISSVSEFKITSKHKSEKNAYQLKVNYGIKENIKISAHNQGTSIEIKNIFEYLPARKKFLKSSNTEWKYCYEVLNQFALCFPQISLKCIHNEKEIFNYKKSQKKERLEKIFKQTKLNSVKQDFLGGEIEIFYSPPGVNFSNRYLQYIFVNKRSVKDKLIIGAIKEAYQTFLEIGKNPAFVVFLDIDNDLIDVNVHPRKSEVKFLRPQEIYQNIFNTLRKSLDTPYFKENNKDPICYYDFYTKNNNNFKALPKNHHQFNFEKNKNTSFSSNQFFNSNLQTETPILKENFELIGQAEDEFLILSKDHKLYFLDQHAIHERERFDKLLEEHKNKKIVQQNLLIPEIISISNAEMQDFLESENFLKNLGFNLEKISENEVKIISVPKDISLNNLKSIILKISSDYIESGKENTIQQISEKCLALISCRGALKFGKRITKEEQERIINIWQEKLYGKTCPHGRPLHIEISFNEIKSKFLR